MKTRVIPAARGGAQTGRLPDAPLSPSEALLEGLTEPGALDVRNRLLEHGASTEFTAGVIQRVLSSGARGTWAIDAAADAIGRLIPVQPSPRRSKHSHVPHIFAFAGPTGAGKSTTMAKLGRRLAADGLKVLFASLAGEDALALKRMGVPQGKTKHGGPEFVAIQGAADLFAALKRRAQTDIIVLDTPGLSARDEEGLFQLSAELDEISALGPLDIYLVLPATRSRASLRMTQSAFQRMKLAACVLTKLDETDEPGAILGEVARTRLPVAFLCDGQDLGADLERPRAGDFADMLLRGKRQ